MTRRVPTYNTEPMCRIKCGCIVESYGAVKELGPGKPWEQPCRVTGEWQPIVEEKVMHYGQTSCAAANRIF